MEQGLVGLCRELGAAVANDTNRGAQAHISLPQFWRPDVSGAPSETCRGGSSLGSSSFWWFLGLWHHPSPLPSSSCGLFLCLLFRVF